MFSAIAINTAAAAAAAAKSLQSCPTLCKPIDGRWDLVSVVSARVTAVFWWGVVGTGPGEQM